MLASNRLNNILELSLFSQGCYLYIFHYISYMFRAILISYIAKVLDTNELKYGGAHAFMDGS